MPVKNYSAEESQLPPGLDPQVIDNLRASQKLYAAKGTRLTLAQVHALEVETEAETSAAE